MGSADRLERFAIALGVVAAICVVSAVVVVVRASTPDEPALVLSRGGAEVSLPSHDWTLTPPSTRFSYAPDARLVAPAVYRLGVCPGVPDSNRGFAGIASARAGLVGSWATGLAGETGRVVSRRRSTVDAGRRVDVTVTYRKPGRCGTPRAAATIVTGENGRALVVVRDLGVPDALSEEELDALIDAVTWPSR